MPGAEVVVTNLERNTSSRTVSNSSGRYVIEFLLPGHYKAGRTQFDPSYDVWFNTSLFPTQAQAPFTLRTFPTIFPDVGSKILNVWDMSVYKEFPIKERVRWQVRADFHNAFNHPWFGNLASNNVTNSQFGKLAASSIDDTSEPRLIVLVMKIVF